MRSSEHVLNHTKRQLVRRWQPAHREGPDSLSKALKMGLCRFEKEGAKTDCLEKLRLRLA